MEAVQNGVAVVSIVVHYDRSFDSAGPTMVRLGTGWQSMYAIEDWFNTTGFIPERVYDPVKEQNAFIFADSYQAGLFRIAWIS